jgi:hypothetical protein
MANEGALPLKGLTCQVEIHQYALNFVILLCIIPDNFICHRESAATQWVSLLLGPIYLKE